MGSMLVPLLITIISVSILIILLMGIRTVMSKRNETKGGEKQSKKSRSTIIRESEKKLAHDPHNVQALTMLGELYFGEKNWEKSFTIYKTLFDIAAAHVDIDISQAALRNGIAAYHLDKLEDAIISLSFALKKVPDSFDAAYYLGRAFYKNNVFDKSIFCLKRAYEINPQYTGVFEPLGFSYFKATKYRESLPYLKKVLDLQPDNKEVMFSIAVAMTETGMGDKALKIFMHLRPDPEFGPRSCIEAGRYHEKAKNLELAIQDYEIGMKLANIPEKEMLQIMYRCANVFIAQRNISKGLELLKRIQNMHQGYKDVDALVLRYTELNQNTNLQTYLLSGTSDFVSLCRKFILAYYPNQNVKVEDISVQTESVEVLCTVASNKMEDKELFRFYRTNSVLGDLNIRDFHSKIRDIKCDRGFCVSMGKFSESAHKFIDGRPIDFIEKDELVKLLKKINMFS
ncbi:MAG: tetratricopeptide repeat protein [Treponema sp.]|nr:tetratricopeptide repeat protein [Treponema sp.]